MNAKKEYTGILLAAIMVTSVFAMAMPAMAEDETATLGVGDEDPTLTSVTFQNAAGSSMDGQSIDVATSYWVNFTVGDTNTIGDLDNVVVKVYYTNQEPGTTNARTNYTFTWTESAAFGDFVSSPTGHLVSNTVPSSNTSASFDFKLQFNISTDAIPSANIGEWYINITATDDSAGSVTNTDNNFDVNKYKDLSSADTTLAYGTLNPGDPIPDLSPVNLTITANTQLNITVEGANLESGAYNIPIANFDVNATTPPTVGGRFTLNILSTSAQVAFNDTAGTACTIETNITGYSSAYTPLDLVFGGGTVPSPQQDGTYTANWPVVCNNDMLEVTEY